MTEVADLAPIRAGDRVFVDARRRSKTPGIYLVFEEEKGPCLRRYGEGFPADATILGRVAAYFRTL